MIIEKLQRNLKRTATIYGALAAFAFAGMGPAATAQTAKSTEGATAATPSTIDATLAAYQQVPLSQASAESMGAKAKAAKVKPVAAEEEEPAAPSKPGREGIKVHGHWVLQVKNADGTLGERREFENSLITTSSSFPFGGGQTTSGAAVLVGVLSGNITLNDLGVAFVQGTLTGDPSLFCGQGSSGTPGVQCYAFVDSQSVLSLNAFSGFYNGVATGLVDTANFAPTASIVLSGNYSVPTGLTSIAGVQSIAAGCESFQFSQGHLAGAIEGLIGSSNFGNADATPSQCNVTATNKGTNQDGTSTYPYALTSTSVPGGPLAVTAGQVVQVTFTLSFS